MEVCVEHMIRQGLGGKHQGPMRVDVREKMKGRQGPRGAGAAISWNKNFATFIVEKAAPACSAALPKVPSTQGGPLLSASRDPGQAMGGIERMLGMEVL